MIVTVRFTIRVFLTFSDWFRLIGKNRAQLNCRENRCEVEKPESSPESLDHGILIGAGGIDILKI